MKRFLGAVLMVVVGCAGGDVGRCKRDSQCPDGAFCDDDTGVCVQESEMRNGGGTGGSGGFNFGGAGGGGDTSAAQNRAGLPCRDDSECPAGSCLGGYGDFEVYTKICVNECGTAGKLDPSKCRTGTTCLLGAGDRAFCELPCKTNSDCSSGLECDTLPSSPMLVCSLKGKSRSSGACTSDSDCVSGLHCDKSVPGGFCTASCSSKSDCPTGDSCVSVNDTTAICMGTCYAPGQQTSCRDGQMCRAVSGVQYGVCF